MARGMAHCDGGTGPNSFDMQAHLERWAEHGIAPEEIIAATHSINNVYKGKGIRTTRRTSSVVIRMR